MADNTKIMLEKLPFDFGKYQKDSNVGKMIAAIEAEVQLLLDTFEDIRKARDVDQAEDAQLDLLAKTVNLTRGSDDNSELRKRIKTEIIANKSQGDLDTVKQVSELVLDTSVSLFEAWNSATYGNEPSTLVLEFQTSDQSFNIPDPIIKKSIAGGVALITQPKLAAEIIGIQEAPPSIFPIIPLKTGTFVISKTMGVLF